MAAWSDALQALVAKLDEIEAQWAAQQSAAAMAVGGVTDRLHALGESMTSETLAVHPPASSAPGAVVGSSQWRLDPPPISLFAPETASEHATSTGLLDRTEE